MHGRPYSGELRIGLGDVLLSFFHLTIGTVITWGLIGFVVIGLVFVALVRVLALVWFFKAIASGVADARSPSPPLPLSGPVRRHTAT